MWEVVQSDLLEALWEIPRKMLQEALWEVLWEALWEVGRIGEVGKAWFDQTSSRSSAQLQVDGERLEEALSSRSHSRHQRTTW